VAELGLKHKKGSDMSRVVRTQNPDPNVKYVQRPGDLKPTPSGYYPNVPVGNSFSGAHFPVAHNTNPLTVSPYRAQDSQDMANYRSQRMPWFNQNVDYIPTQGERKYGLEDVMQSGIPAPVLQQSTRTASRWQGTSNTANLNNTTPKSPYGVQDGTTWTVVMDHVKSNPRLSPYTGESSVVRIPPSGVNGLHTNPVISGASQSANTRKTQPRQVPTGQDRLSNSKVAGQTFSATTVHAGQVAATPQQGRGGSRNGR